MWSVRWVASTGSTNADVAAAARDGTAEGLLVVADHQTAGRGRLDRRWEAPAGASVAMSFLLRPDDVSVVRWPWLPLLMGVAVVDAVDAAGARDVRLKWPNDVLAGGRKLAGILVERVDTPLGPAAVAGVGINLSQAEEQLPAGATSLRLARADVKAVSGADAVSGTEIDREDVVARVSSSLEQHYTDWHAAAGDPAAGLAAAYAQRCDTLGRDVRVELPAGGDMTGRAVEIDEFGRLVLDTGGATTAVGAGDIVHLRPAAAG
ncbi:BirA family biotin operon repressor/biotin-[acetyl-CoA-carboxylase] ligase [Haloactinopolyspora alba]|uniref:biotin--[biotin carboxyl-carrier protein] ligase n=1 Tax=Haloactinopolyspora alba TaxID=648780 RepID=A0A2P8E117_9ACTN|nr:biotin--[acetyl-CoA-carboxylase] ligase [Haloactinopolyspora alba]PSL03172.1 BirA family biotin operon repressor/biotin-[acetyl-CoA-carboxylase] ligase [Haloactinopolyspora alba]